MEDYAFALIPTDPTGRGSNGVFLTAPTLLYRLISLLRGDEFILKVHFR